MRSGFVHEMNVPNRTFNPKRREKKGKQNQKRQKWINYRAGTGDSRGTLMNQPRTFFCSRRASRFEVKQDQHNSGMDARGACSFSSVNVQVERTGSWMSHERLHFPRDAPVKRHVLFEKQDPVWSRASSEYLGLAEKGEFDEDWSCRIDSNVLKLMEP